MDMEQTALNLKCLLTVMSAVNCDDDTALKEMPIVAKIALEMVENLYCCITK